MLKDDKPPIGPGPSVRKAGIAKEDQIVLAVMAVIAAAVFIGCALTVRWVLQGMFGAFDDAAAGIGFRSAFLLGTGLATALMVLFAIVAGDGLLGELPTMIIGFFVMIAFFTMTIAFVF